MGLKACVTHNRYSVYLSTIICAFVEYTGRPTKRASAEVKRQKEHSTETKLVIILIKTKL